MKNTYRYSIDVFMADSIGRKRPIHTLEFDSITKKVRVSYKKSESKDFMFGSPEMMKEITNERTSKIIVVVKADDIDEALFRAEKVLEEKIALISFLSMFPVKCLNKGSIAEELTEKKDVVEHLIRDHEQLQVHNLQLIESIELLHKQPDDKIIQSLRWFRKGLLDINPFDSFISLWIAFEMISSSLKPTDMKRLLCSKCGQEIESCPHCDASTRSKPMEKDGIINHISNTLNITDSNYYRGLNNMRNDIFHGRSKNVKLKKLKEELGKLRYCLLTAYWFLIYGDLPDTNSEKFQRFDFYFIQQGEMELKMGLEAKGLRELLTDDALIFSELI